MEYIAEKYPPSEIPSGVAKPLTQALIN